LLMHAQAHVTGEPDGAIDAMTWRASPQFRIARAAAFAFLLTPAELILWLMLYIVRVPYAGWFALALALVAWTWLARRVWIQSVTLTTDFVVLGKIIARSERIALAGITAVTFRLGTLTITAGGWRYKVLSLPLGARYWSGRRCGADDTADAIAAAAGLPALPQRKRIIGLGTSLALIPLMAATMALGHELEVSHRTQLPGLIGGWLFALGLWLLCGAITVSFDHVRGRLAR